MKKFTCALMLVAALVSTRALVAAETTETSSLSDAIPDARGSGGIYFNAGGGLSVYNGSTGWGLNFGAVTPLWSGTGLYAGVDLAATFYSISTAGVLGAPFSSSMTGFQLTPTLLYRFDLSGVRGIAPYVGVSVGPNLFRTTVNNNSTSEVFLQAMFRPGIFIDLGGAVGLLTEAKFGWLGGNFNFFPHANVTFAI